MVMDCSGVEFTGALGGGMRPANGKIRTITRTAHQMMCRVAAFIRGVNRVKIQAANATAAACQRLFTTAAKTTDEK